MKTLLLTFGCSWTYGVGVGYQSGMSKDEYDLMAWDPNICNKLSWRGVISDKYDLFNRNFAAAGSSNQKQDRLAMQYVTSVNFQDDQNTFDKIILLWGITSTARNEMFSLEKNKLDNFLLNDPSMLAKSLLKFSYNHDFEVWLLARKIRFWNLLFSKLNIKNLWFDTFNHHDYNIVEPVLDYIEDTYDAEESYNQVKGNDWPSWQSFCHGSDKIDDEILKEIMEDDRWSFWRHRRQYDHCRQPILNLIYADQNPRDLMSLLCVKNGFDNIDQQYHRSDWSNDTNRVEYLEGKSILNPLTKHPTKLGQEQIADILSEHIEKLL
jgi:hypothetical protein